MPPTTVRLGETRLRLLVVVSLFVAVLSLVLSAFALSRSDNDHAAPASTVPSSSELPSTSTETVVIPDVIGLGVDQAVKVLSSLGLHTTTALEHSATNPPTVVIAESPTAGSHVPTASTVDLVVSLGP